jgi:enterochelin esterase-like enzyme
MIFQDGQAWLRPTGDMRATFVLDNLIYRREIPVTIAVFINPGRTPEQPVATPAEWGDRTSPTGPRSTIRPRRQVRPRDRRRADAGPL